MSISLKFKGKTYRKLFSNLEPPRQQAELVVHGRLQKREGKKNPKEDVCSALIFRLLV